ncbi:hypothetical protein LR48_Vigan04g155700 [Vigna angularis]|uniref:Uncharacterized protein n=1 Tax=Phaseolus angularis TaxID=3914 RepID=A0A0L9UFN4_PHAAN|nr:hypothetical protein LR48_Vigan04g155700 [Vigna angularis]
MKLKKTTLEKEEEVSSVLEPDEEEDEDVEKNPMKKSAEMVDKSPKVRNELVKVIEKSYITKSVKALKRSTKSRWFVLMTGSDEYNDPYTKSLPGKGYSGKKVSLRYGGWKGLLVVVVSWECFRWRGSIPM